MGTVLASALIARAATILNDAGNVRWGATELLDYINAAQREIATLKPDASATNSAVQLVAGTLQSIPAGAILLLDIPRNMGTNGTTVGPAISRMEKDILDSLYADWQKATASATVEFYIYDRRYPNKFWVYPPQPGTEMGYVDIFYATNPADVSGTDKAITLDDIYQNAILDYMLYRALQKNMESDFGPTLSKVFRESFLGTLGIKSSAEQVNAPGGTAGVVQQAKEAQ